MKLLLDTHIWLWSLLQPEKLSRRVTRELQNTANELWLSPISIWELLILCKKGRVVLHEEAGSWIEKAIGIGPFREAPVTQEVALETRRVALPHRDPVDHFLVATAKVFELTLVTGDEHLMETQDVPVLANRSGQGRGLTLPPDWSAG